MADGGETSKEVSGWIISIGQSRWDRRCGPANDLPETICHQSALEERGEAATVQAAERVTWPGLHFIHASRIWGTAIVCCCLLLFFFLYYWLPQTVRQISEVNINVNILSFMCEFYKSSPIKPFTQYFMLSVSHLSQMHTGQFHLKAWINAQCFETMIGTYGLMIVSSVWKIVSEGIKNEKLLEYINFFC